MKLIILICIFIMGLFIIYLLLLKKQIREMIQQLQFIIKHKTNMTLNTKIIETKEIKELAISINKLIQAHRNLEIELQKTNKAFKETITNVSHDLRTPLTSANGYLQLLKDANTPEEKKEEYIGIMKDRISTVKEMLEQLFEYARIEAEEYVLQQEKICLNTVLLDTISEFYQDFIRERY